MASSTGPSSAMVLGPEDRAALTVKSWCNAEGSCPASSSRVLPVESRTAMSLTLRPEAKSVPAALGVMYTASLVNGAPGPESGTTPTTLKLPTAFCSVRSSDRPSPTDPGAERPLARENPGLRDWLTATSWAEAGARPDARGSPRSATPE